MGLGDLHGTVVVVLGRDPRLAAVAAGAHAAGALVGLVMPDRYDVDTALGFRADPTDRATVERIAAHLEQRLGPVDAVVADTAAAAVADEVLGPDLRRRQHGTLVVLGDEDADAVLSRLVGRR